MQPLDKFKIQIKQEKTPKKEPNKEINTLSINKNSNSDSNN